jgi:hypothetical protein
MNIWNSNFRLFVFAALTTAGLMVTSRVGLLLNDDAGWRMA